MSLFIVFAFLILVVTLLLLTRPLLKTRNTLSHERQAQNIHFAKERLQELETQLKNASISATDYEALKLEIESNLAGDIDLENQSKVEQTITPRRSNKLTIALLCLLLPLLTASLYWATGTPSALAPQAKMAERPSVEQVEQKLTVIEQRLKANPNDARGWTVLARTYLSLGRFKEARDGFLKLLELNGESGQLLTSLADTSALLAGGDMSGEPIQYIERALELEPNNPQALWLAGLSAVQQNQTEEARVYWNKLLPQLAGAPQQQQKLKTIIEETFEQSANGFANLGAQAQKSNAASEKGPKKESKTESQTQGSVTASLNVSVSIAPTVLKNSKADDLVFVFVKAKNGPPAPLAVKRLSVADLPAKVTLSDADAMIPQLTISKFADLVVSARIAKSGNPVAQTGDIQSAEIETNNDTQDEITLEINTIIK